MSAKNVGGLVASVLFLSGCLNQNKSGSYLQNSSAAEITFGPGVFAKQIIFAAESSALGIKSRGKTERLMLVTVVKQGDQLKASGKTCAYNATSDGAAVVNFPASFAESTPILENIYNPTAAGYTSDEIVDIIGSRLQDPKSEALPTSAEDPRVFDQDKDQHPGMTVQVKVRAGFIRLDGDVYLTQRSIWTERILSGSQDGQTIYGQVLWDITQKTLGSNSRVIASVQPVLKALQQESRVAFHAVAPDAKCSDIIAAHDSYFGKL